MAPGIPQNIIVLVVFNGFFVRCFYHPYIPQNQQFAPEQRPSHPKRTFIFQGLSHFSGATVDGQNPAPADMVNYPIILFTTGFSTIPGDAGFLNHQQYVSFREGETKRSNINETTCGHPVAIAIVNHDIKQRVSTKTLDI